MPSISAVDLENKYGSVDKIAEAWINGDLDATESRLASEMCSKADLEAAWIRLCSKCVFQTRRYSGEVKEFNSLKEAMKDAEDLQVWKLSFNIPFSDQRIRLVREGSSDFVFQPIILD